MRFTLSLCLVVFLTVPALAESENPPKDPASTASETKSEAPKEESSMELDLPEDEAPPVKKPSPANKKKDGRKKS